MWPVREPSPISRLISHVSSLLKHISCLSSPASSYFSCLPSLVSSLLSPNFSSPVSRLSILKILSSSLTLLQHPLPLKPLADGNGGGAGWPPGGQSGVIFFFCNFWKWAHCYQLAIFLWVRFQKIGNFCHTLAVDTPKSFHFKKSLRP